MPLQPSGETLRARIALQNALRRLEPEPGYILSAEYFSIDDSFFDVENVLIYNIGTGTFRNASKNGIRFLRHRQAPVSAPNGSLFPHLHQYRFVPLSGPQSGHKFCFEVPRLTASLKPHDIWWRAADAHCTELVKLQGLFSLHLELTTAKPIVNVAGILKPFLDGVVCAMHSDFQPDGEVVRRIAAKSGWDAALITQKLKSTNIPFLGDKRLVQAYRDYVKWDPADHLCESCTLVVLTGVESRCIVTIGSHNSASVVA